MNTRTEKDSLGEVQVPADALYAAQTQRAIDNFNISQRRMPRAFLQALGLIKFAAAATNAQLQVLDNDISQAIQSASLSVSQGQHDDQFLVDVFQTGSGTSTNMNANEVIARLASTSSHTVHPNDEVNASQSSNDVIPTAIHVSVALQLQPLFEALQALIQVLHDKANHHDKTVKTGRTHLMDAMPLTLQQELSGWQQQLKLNVERLQESLPRLLQLAQGGTAVGTGVNTPAQFAPVFCQQLNQVVHQQSGHSLTFRPAENCFSAISSQDTAVEVSGHLNTLAVSLMKIANDLRWMNSGPITGLAEIQLPAIQPGSSIMPGKVNPVVPEAVAMVCAQVMGNHTTITVAGQSGNFQLNVMLPVIASNLLESCQILTHSLFALVPVIDGFTVNEPHLQQGLDKNPILVTALNRVIGYETGAKIAKRAYQEKRPLIDVALEETDLGADELQQLLNPYQLTQSG